MAEVTKNIFADFLPETGHYRVRHDDQGQVADVLDTRGRVTCSVRSPEAIAALVMRRGDGSDAVPLWWRLAYEKRADAERAERARVMAAAAERSPKLRTAFEEVFPYREVTAEGSPIQVFELVGPEATSSEADSATLPEYAAALPPAEGEHLIRRLRRWHLGVLRNLGMRAARRFRADDAQAWADLNNRVQVDAERHYGPGQGGCWEDMEPAEAASWASRFTEIDLDLCRRSTNYHKPRNPEVYIQPDVPWTAPDGREFCVVDVS